MQSHKLNITCLAILCLLVSRLHAQGPASAETGAPPANVSVHVPTTATELAAGYAAAVGQMTLQNVAIHYRHGTGTLVFKGIRSVRALSGVLLVTLSPGDMIALNAEQIMLIADGSRVPEAPAAK